MQTNGDSVAVAAQPEVTAAHLAMSTQLDAAIAALREAECCNTGAHPLQLETLIAHLVRLSELVRDGHVQSAAKLHSDFSVLPHGAWLARRGKQDPKRMAEIGRLGGKANSAAQRSARSKGKRSSEPRAPAKVIRAQEATRLLEAVSAELASDPLNGSIFGQLLTGAFPRRIQAEMKRILKTGRFPEVRRALKERLWPLRRRMPRREQLQDRLYQLLRHRVPKGNTLWIVTVVPPGVPLIHGPFDSPREISIAEARLELGASVYYNTEDPNDRTKWLPLVRFPKLLP